MVERGLERDDDIIQQWFDADDILKLLNAAKSWEEMVLAVDSICGSHEVDAAARQYAESVLGGLRS